MAYSITNVRLTASNTDAAVHMHISNRYQRKERLRLL